MDNEQKSYVSNLFYNKRANLERESNIEKRARFMQTNPVPLPTSSGILGYTQIFKVFNKQSIALENMEEFGLDLMVFSFEGKAVGEGGRRNFLVCHPRMLWKNIKDRPPDFRCTYEVIPEGKISKLYFDLEFSKELNPKLDGNFVTSLFIHIVNYYLFKEFNIICDTDKVLDLESSTDKKFSRHLIYNHQNIGFENNYHVGRFVNMICENLKQIFHDEISTVSIPNISKNHVKKLFVQTSSSTVLFCDQGVYTRNRNFRIFGSTKLGKHSSLVLANENKYKPSLHTESCDENYFLDSLVTFVPADVKTLKYGSEDCRASKSFLKCSKETEIEGCGNLTQGSISPYPEIEDFINKYLGEENLIRTWRYFRDGELLVFDIDKRHRYCNNIGREHKSNSIMYVVNLKLEVFYQKCHDPDCKGYKSNEIKLPRETMPWKLLAAESATEESDDEILVAAVEKVEEEKYETVLYNNNVSDFDLQSKSIELNSHKMEQQGLCTPPINASKDKENTIVLPSPWSHLSEIETPSSVADEFNSLDKSFALTMPNGNDSYPECVSDEEMLKVYSGFEKQTSW